MCISLQLKLQKNTIRLAQKQCNSKETNYALQESDMWKFNFHLAHSIIFLKNLPQTGDKCNSFYAFIVYLFGVQY